MIHDSPQKEDLKKAGTRRAAHLTARPVHHRRQEDRGHRVALLRARRQATEALCKLSRDGVQVRILTNSLASNDVSAVHAGYAKYRRKLLRCGVRLFELDESLKDREGKMFTWLPGLAKSSLHAKTMVFDGEIMFVGSFNFDQRSLHINNEIGLVFHDPAWPGRRADTSRTTSTRSPSRSVSREGRPRGHAVDGRAGRPGRGHGRGALRHDHAEADRRRRQVAAHRVTALTRSEPAALEAPNRARLGTPCPRPAQERHLHRRQCSAVGPVDPPLHKLRDSFIQFAHRAQARSESPRRYDCALQKSVAELDVLGAIGNRLGDPEIVRLEAEGDYAAGRGCLEVEQPISPSLEAESRWPPSHLERSSRTSRGTSRPRRSNRR